MRLLLEWFSVDPSVHLLFISGVASVGVAVVPRPGVLGPVLDFQHVRRGRLRDLVPEKQGIFLSDTRKIHAGII